MVRHANKVFILIIALSGCQLPMVSKLNNPLDPANIATKSYTLTPGTLANGSMTPASAATVAAGAATQIVATPSSGYAFTGWSASPSANASFANATSASTTVTLSGNAIITPAFSLATAGMGSYTVTYNANYDTTATTSTGSVPTDSTSYQSGQTVTVLGNPGNLALGYSHTATLTGWNTKADGSGTTYTSGQKFAIGSANVTLFAQWSQAAPYSLTYKADGGNGSVPTDSGSYQKTYQTTIVGNTGGLAKTSYTWGGWNTRADGSGTTYAAGNTITFNQNDIILYALWTPIYTVTYINPITATSGTLPSDPNNYQTGQTVTVKSNSGSLMITGSYLASWNTKADNTGTSYSFGSSLTMGSANITLYAQWAQMPSYSWSQPTSLPIYNQENNRTQCMASSADGTYLYVADNAGYLYTSSNSGATWAQRFGLSSHSWLDVSCSADGKHAVACTGDASSTLWISNDYGASWNPSAAGLFDNLNNNDNHCLVSADGSTIYISSYSLQVSFDHGANWTLMSQTSYRFYSLACSPDGSSLFAVDTSGNVDHWVLSNSVWFPSIPTNSNNFPAATQVTSMGVFQWAGITCSTDGGTINRFDGTTFSSFNLTNTTLVTNTTPLSAGGAHIACSSDGKKIFVCTTAAGGHNVAMSPDGGTTWQSWPVGGSSNNMIDGVACSADGTKVIIGGGGVVGFWLGSH